MSLNIMACTLVCRFAHRSVPRVDFSLEGLWGYLLDGL
jgi:hypothetical protein